MSLRPVTPSTAPTEMRVLVYFPDRIVPRTGAVLTSAIQALLAGPTSQERARGAESWFSTATVDMVRSVRVSGGHAVIDFGDLRRAIPNASASAGSQLLLEELDATVFQFPSVETAEYRMNDSCTDFNEWLQFGGCDPRGRPSSNVGG